MRRLSFRRKLALAASIAALGAGAAAAAILATGGSGRATGGKLAAQTAAARLAGGVSAAAGPGTVSAAARYLGLSRTQLRQELSSGHTLAELAAHRRGRSTAGLIDAIVSARAARLKAWVARGALSLASERQRLASLRQRLAIQVNRRRRGGRRQPGEGQLAAAARYLSISGVRLRAQLRAGQSLAQLANRTPGRSAAGLIAVLLRERTAALDAARAAGRLSPQAEAALMPVLRGRISAIVNGSRAGS